MIGIEGFLWAWGYIVALTLLAWALHHLEARKEKRARTETASSSQSPEAVR
ncbi:hypothetical protein SEA_STEAMY_59 [Mycobacterium phage Steamy]|uniref:Heme exporter protein D n=1 Tax=Mycobacterium phage Steamy TaxID=2250309 RepID=A0A345L0N1_9CAUD|nr:hypothetical protein KIV62_gp42 [Mycobacterium phage Steamy]AXH48833.1 hypothetical protein SEA_STEAMY_59 [Mycobacterium phage Steamy]